MKSLILPILLAGAITTFSCTSARRSAESVRHANINTNTSSDPMLSFEGWQIRNEGRQIRNERQEVTYETLANDEAVIHEAWPVILDRLQRNGFSEEEAREATFLSWRELRVKRLSPQQPLTAAALESYAGSLGKLVINSTPSDADVEIDGDVFDRKTNTAAWLGPGHYRIKVSKSGFAPAENSYTVREGTKTEAHFTLRQEGQQ